MNQKFLIGTLVIFLAILGYLYWKVNNISSNAPSTKSFNLVLQDKAYNPDTVRVRLGDTVIFNIDNKDNENHGLHLPQFGLAEAVPPLQKTSIQFVANKTGSVSTSCAVGHPEKINVIVESS